MSNDPYGKPPADDDVFELEDGLSLDDTDSKYYVDPGNYPAKVIDVIAEESKAGKPMWTWTFAILGTDRHAGKELKVWTSLQPTALFKLKEVVEALGVWIKGTKLRFKRTECIGKKCVLEVVDSEYQGKTNSSVEHVHEYTLEHYPATHDPTAPTQPSGRPASSPGENEDDIPF